jgi:predicted molibdopterin-dependent oxidoreductase YjgC
MPKLIIDDITLEVSEGTNILEAAKTVGITIPHFCWHPALGKAGACRACAVKVVEGPAKGLQMSCMVPVQEGMVVSTTDSEAVEGRDPADAGVVEHCSAARISGGAMLRRSDSLAIHFHLSTIHQLSASVVNPRSYSSEFA